MIKMSNEIKVDVIQSAIPATDNKYKYLFDWKNNIDYVIIGELNE